MNKHISKLSVHEFVDLVLEGGDLLFGGASGKRLLEGIETHTAIQEKSNAKSEFSLSYTQLTDMAVLELSGRVDLLRDYGKIVTIEELKSTYQKLDSIKKPTQAHLIQAKCYAAMYSVIHDVDEIEVTVTYVSVKTHEFREFPQVFKSDNLINWLRSKCDEILYQIELDIEHIIKRNESANDLAFPYPEFINGQRNMSAYVYLTSRDCGISYLCAPTGIGKTMGALYPCIRSMGEGMGEKRSEERRVGKECRL